MSKKRRLAYLALLANALIWGAAIPLVKYALPYTTPFRWLFYRYLIAAPLSLPLLFFALKSYKPKLQHLVTIIIMELVGTTAVLGILYEGVKRTSAIDASLITETAPVFIVLGGIIFLHEREERHEWIGMILALIGTFIVILSPYFLTGKWTNGGSISGNLLLLGQNLLWMIYVLVAKRVYRKIPKLFIAVASFWVGLVTFAFLSRITDVNLVIAELSNIPVLTAALYMAIPGSIIALTLYLYGLNKIEASEATLFGYLQPLVSVPLAVFWLGDKLTFPVALGMVVIALGVYLAEMRQRRV